MQTIRKAPPRTGGVGTTLSLLLLGVLLTLAALLFCLTHLRTDIESDISYRVSAALSGTGVGAENITVEGLDITLSGNIETKVAKDEIAKLAGGVFGVARVYNELKVGPAGNDKQTAAPQTLPPDNSLSSGEPVENSGPESNTDTENAGHKNTVNSSVEESELVIAQKTSADRPAETKNTLAATENLESSNTANVNDEPVAASTLQLIVSDGVVNVQGIVPDIETVERINTAIAGKFGVANVEDDMSTYAGSAEPVWIDGAISLIDQMDDIQNPSIKITEGEVILGGNISSETLGQQKLALATRLLGIYLPVSSDFKLIDRDTSTLPAPEAKPRTVTKRPPSVKIRSINNTVTLSGTISTFEDSETIRNAMAGVFGVDNYTDKLIIDDSVASADWFEEVVQITDNVKSIDNFSVSINSGQLLLSGNIADRNTGQELQATAAELLGNRLAVVNNYSIVNSNSLIDNNEDLLSRELMRELDSIATEAIIFNKNSATLTDNAKSVLDSAAEIILSFDGQVVEIAGHTDSAGDALANLELSKKRADAVREYLLEQQIPADQLRPIGYGETIPIADNSTPEGRAANRRIEFNL